MAQSRDSVRSIGLGAILGVTVTLCFAYPFLDPRLTSPVTKYFSPIRSEYDVKPSQPKSTASHLQRALSRKSDGRGRAPPKESAPLLKNITCPEDGRPPSLMAALDCRRRLPTVIGIGAMKCGTGALSFFLEAHPYIVRSYSQEVHFWTRHFERGMDWYREQMPISSKYQVTMEKTPEYLRHSNISAMIKKLMPSTTKFILVVRDPFSRAVSNYVHHLAMKGRDKMSRETFEASVFAKDGSIVRNNWVINGGIYGKYFQKWLADFPLRRFLVIDGDQLQANPVPILQEVETFLGLPKYFDESSVYFDNEKGFYCRTHEDPEKRCLGQAKGRPHPVVSKQVENRVREFYRPRNAVFERMVGKKFNWK
ncbi:heparan sulfate glucosamine 3-O-sulfotransferase 1-like [Diadema setosum]|uniref:heparan sulfate glucosamine 3-O-sulfotransferase 1-like n=1 Tax=Diadema setosum TaxID=31175 RepID=UPI003B3B434B